MQTQSCSWNREGSLYTNIVWQIEKGGKCKFDLRGVESFGAFVCGSDDCACRLLH